MLLLIKKMNLDDQQKKTVLSGLHVAKVHDDGNMTIVCEDGSTYETEIAEIETPAIETMQAAPQATTSQMRLKYATELEMQPLCFPFLQWAAQQHDCTLQVHGGFLYSITFEHALLPQRFTLLTDFNNGTCQVEYSHSGKKDFAFPSLAMIDRTLEVAARFREFLGAVVE